MSTKIIHKAGKQTAEIYTAFGQYVRIKAPLCAGAKALYRGKSYYTHRLWKYVTCKKCLRIKNKHTEAKDD